MAEKLEYYIDILSGNKSGLSAIGSLQSLDNAAAKASTNIQGLEAKLRSAQAAQRAAANGGSAKEQFKALDAVKLAQDKLTSAQQANAGSSALMAAKRNLLKKGLDEQVASLGKFASSAKEAGGPLGSLVGKLEGFSKGGPVGVAIAVAVALAGLAAAAAYVAFAMTKYAFASADAARSSRLFSEAALGSAVAGNELEQVVDQMSNIAPGLAAKLKDVGRSLADVQIKGRDAQHVLNTFGLVATARSEQAAGSIKNVAEASKLANRLMLGPLNRITGEFDSLKGTGIKSADVFRALGATMGKSAKSFQDAKTIGLVPFKEGLKAIELAAQISLGGVVAKQAMGLSVQLDKLKENVAKLFSGVNIEAFLAGLKMVTDLFDQNTVTGYVLREVLTAVFTKVAEVAAKVFPYVKVAIQGVVFGMLLVVGVARKVYTTIASVFEGAGKNIDGLSLAFQIGAGAVGLVVGSILGLTAALVLLGTVAAVATAPIWVPFVVAAIAIYAMVSAVESIMDSVSTLADDISAVDLGKAAGNLMDSLINGIKGKLGAVGAVMAEVGSVLTGAFDTKMKIASPSKVMQERADFVIDPLVTTPNDRANEVRTSIGNLAKLDAPERAGQGGGNGQTGGGDITFTNCTFGSGPMEDVRRVIREERDLFFMGIVRGNAVMT